MKIQFGKNCLFSLPVGVGPVDLDSLRTSIAQKLDIPVSDFYLISNGKKLTEKSMCSDVHVVLRLPGGKGGFGSMLRAIGAQIEKTTNREACRDLSGRRLRDINEEQRLKKWVAQQAEREKEAKEKKKKKLEKLLEKPKFVFEDKEYDKERSELPEKVEDAVLKGLEASCSNKRKSDGASTSKPVKKKPKLWVDSELDDELSSSESDIDDEGSKSPASSLKSDTQSSSLNEPNKNEDKTLQTTECTKDSESRPSGDKDDAQSNSSQ